MAKVKKNVTPEVEFSCPARDKGDLPKRILFDARSPILTKGVIAIHGLKMKTASPARLLGALERSRFSAKRENASGRVFHARPLPIAAGLALAARGMLTQRDARVIELLPHIKAPSLVVVGADDTPFLAASDYMAAKIPGAQKVVIPAAGHAVNIDQPKAFIDAVTPFLDHLDAKAPS